MNQITITLLGPVVVNQPNAAKKYKQMTVTHQEDGKDKPEGKKIFDFATPKEVWDTLLAAKPGDRFQIDRQKDEKEGKYWEWKAIRPASSGASSASAPAQSTVSVSNNLANPAGGATTTRVGSWETPEERAQKQIYIVRQSTINAAIEYFKSIGSTTHTERNVLQTARDFEDYVFGNGVAGLTDDIPE